MFIIELQLHIIKINYQLTRLYLISDCYATEVGSYLFALYIAAAAVYIGATEVYLWLHLLALPILRYNKDTRLHIVVIL